MAQIAANKRNGAKNRGPRSQEGRSAFSEARSLMNALRHCLAAVSINTTTGTGLVPPPAGVEGRSMEHFEPLSQIPKLRARVHHSLTTRERQIVLVLSEGLTNKEIARRLRLTEGT